MPLELNPLVAAAELDPTKTVRVDDKTFYVGRLAGNDVVLAMTGIGLVNAENTATAAFEHFTCRFRGALFSGVAGSQRNIGDVAIPARWTRDGGTSWTGVDPGMLRVARGLQGTDKVKLAQDVPVGDAACLCPGVDAATPVHMPGPMAVWVGGDGTSSDTFGDKALVCVPGGGDIAGCQPCVMNAGFAGEEASAFATHVPDYADPAFFQSFFAPPDATTQDMDSQDEETAAVAQVAGAYHVPFLGVRAVSDGHGDPLGLPGFPVQFFVYRQLAGNNAAAVTIAFLQAWAAKHQPVGS
jgi:nucleoside phosphorylase